MKILLVGRSFKSIKNIINHCLIIQLVIDTMNVQTAKTATKPTGWTGWTRCLGCKSAVRAGTTLDECTTCKKVASGVLVPCSCGSLHLKVYRAKGFAAKNCIRCIWLGHQEVRTDAQELALERWDICPGICGLVQPITHGFCHDCQAVADVDVSQRRKLSSLRTHQRVAKRDAAWNQAMWSGAWATVDAKLEAEKTAAEAKAVEEAKAAAEAKDEEEDLLRILRSAQSGKGRNQYGSKPVAVSRSVAATKPVVESTTKPVKVVVVLNRKNPLVGQARPNFGSVSEFPVLGTASAA